MGDVEINIPVISDTITTTDTNFVATVSDSQTLIAEVCDEIKAMLLEKNRKYGDSALNPTRIFAKSDSVEQIKVRIDDKLNRLKNAQDDEDEDVVLDLMGYLVLLRVAQLKAKNDVVVPEDEFDWNKWLEEIHKIPADPYVPQPYRWPGDPYVSPTVKPWERPQVTFTENICDDGHSVTL